LSSRELYRSSGRRLSAKLVPTFADRGVSRGQRNGSPRPDSRLSRPDTGQHKHRMNAHKHPCLEWDSNTCRKTPRTNFGASVLKLATWRLCHCWIIKPMFRSCKWLYVPSPFTVSLSYAKKTHNLTMFQQLQSMQVESEGFLRGTN
jgi:hypothetical protein